MPATTDQSHSSHGSPADINHAEAYETEHVHDVYQQIASHFSSTRYKPWPIVERFLLSQKPGAIGLDIGCGNGKYLTVNRDVFIVASDRSEALAQIATQHHPHSTIVADILHLPHPASSFDFAISIAVVHHLSTPARRVEAIAAILQTLKPASSTSTTSTTLTSNDSNGGQALIYVWALEQKTSRRGWDKGHEQDVMVPWVLRNKPAAAAMDRQDKKDADADANADTKQDDKQQQRQLPPPQDQVFHRYYHLYEENELERDIRAAGGVVIESGYEKDNWWAIASRLKS